MATDDRSAAFDGWAVLELMGHRRLGGLVREETVAGAAFVRIDVPAVGDNPAFSQFYSPQAVYCITPASEAVARAIAASVRHEPVSRYELPQLVAASGPIDVDADPYPGEPDDEPDDDDGEI